MRILTVLSAFTLLFLVPTAGAQIPNLADRHGTKGITCEACHKTQKPEPFAEVPASQCNLCHPQQGIVEKYASLKDRNPHKNHLGEVDCNICHKGHAPSTVYCDQCHSNFKLNIR